MNQRTFLTLIAVMGFSLGLFLWKTAEKYGIEEGIIYCNEHTEECAIRYHYLKLNSDIIHNKRTKPSSRS